MESGNAKLVDSSRKDSRLNHFIGVGALIVAMASAVGGYQFNTWQKNNATELAESQSAQEARLSSAFLSMVCVLQSQQAVAELQYRPQAASQIFESLEKNELSCQSVGVSLTTRAAWFVKKYPQRIDRKIVERAARVVSDKIPTVQLSRLSSMPDGGFRFDEAGKVIRLERDVDSVPTNELKLSEQFLSTDKLLLAALMRKREFSNDIKAAPVSEPIKTVTVSKDQSPVGSPKGIFD